MRDRDAERRFAAEVEAKRLAAELDRYKVWVADLQSGMYVNCVYCGHRYGPREATPTSKADLLKAHLATCPEPLMSKLIKAVEIGVAALGAASSVVDRGDGEDYAYQTPLEYMRAALKEAQ